MKHVFGSSCTTQCNAMQFLILVYFEILLITDFGGIKDMVVLNMDTCSKKS